MAKKLLIRLSENKMQSLSKHKKLKDARILITNDDGYEADGIKLLTKETVELVAPMVEKLGRRLKIEDFDDKHSLRGCNEL